MNQSIKYSNRYNSVYTLTKTQGGNILWEGDFEWCRYGNPNVYDDAYNQYIEDGGKLNFEDFKTEAHAVVTDVEGNYISMSETSQKYAKLIYSDKTKIDMVDASGGPYLYSGYDMGMFDESFKGMIIENFIPCTSDANSLPSYLIIIKK
jgi:hypothetical protein